MTDFRHLPPVEPVAVPERFSQSLLARDDNCPRSAYLAAKYRNGPSSHEMDRGTLFHEFAARAMTDLIRQGEKRLAEQPEQAASMTAAIVDEVLRDMPELAMRRRDVDDAREMAFHWAVGYDVDPQTVAGLERLFVLDLDCGVRVSGRMDLIAFPSDTLGQVDDYKTAWSMPSQDDYDESFQAWMYGLLLCFGRPVLVTPCADCDAATVDLGGDCQVCGGSGYVEELEEPIGKHLTGVWARELYPRSLREDGLLQHREVTMSRQALVDFKADVERQAVRLLERFESWDFPARAGSWCSTCPASSECPLPAHLRDHAGAINSREEAEEAWAKVLVAEDRISAVKKEVKNWAKVHGPIRVGDLEWCWEPKEGKAVRRVRGRSDWEGLEAAVREAAEYGTPFDLREFVKPTAGSEFKKRKVKTDAEVAA